MKNKRDEVKNNVCTKKPIMKYKVIYIYCNNDNTNEYNL